MANNCCGGEDLVDNQSPDTNNSGNSRIKWSGTSKTFGATAGEDEEGTRTIGHGTTFCDGYPATEKVNGFLTTHLPNLPRTVHDAAQGDMEVKLASIWRELFHVEKISRFDTFLALGGHSLLAVRFINRVKSFGARLSISSVLSPITLCELARMIELDLQKSIYALPPIEPVPSGDLVPLTFAQQRVWLVVQKNRDSGCSSVSVELRLRGTLNPTAWQDSLNAMLLRHRILGATFVLIDGEPRMRVDARITAIPIQEYDLRAADDSEKALEHLRQEEARETFEISTGPLIRTQLIRLADEEYVFTLARHRLIADDWSVWVLLRELGIVYGAFAARQSNPLSPLKIQYKDYAAWERQWLSNDNLQPLAEYWRTRLEGMPATLNLPTDRPRRGRLSYAGESVHITLDAELTKSLKNLSKQHGTTLFATILTGWTAVLSRLSGQDDVVIGTSCANRHRADIEGLIGLFANVLALRIDTSGAPNVAEMLSRVREVTIGALDHQELPFDRVGDIAQPERGTAASPIFQVMFSWRQDELCEMTAPGLRISVENPDVDSIQVDLHLDLCERNDAVCGSLGFAAELFDRETVSRYVYYLQATLRAMVADVGMTMDKIDVLSPAERTLMLETWNATALAQPDHLCAHQVIETHALETPGATAVMYEDEILTYSELNSRANRLARRLIELGVVPDQLVGLCVSRSSALIIGLLAILKAGGGYVPLDPIYASSRLVRILDDVAPSVVVADRAGCMAIGEEPLANVIVVDPNSSYSYLDSNPKITGLTSRNLMYGIYTSGSTGIPKGIMVEHRGFVNLTLSQIPLYEIRKNSRILQFTSIGFDVSVGEIMMALMSGAALHVSPQHIRQDPYKLWEHIDKRGITHVSLVPSFLRDCSTLPPISIVPTVILCGEASSPWLVQNLRHRAKFINAYGPAETLPYATVWKDEGVLPGDLVPIGRPLPNVRLYILDSYGQPVPLGAVGELYIGGIGVARGYLNRPGLTRERFRSDPFVDSSDARFYKTGDLARYLSDGNLLYIGRNDEQVKIRGFRIEPGEIESCLKTYPAVREAFVTVFEEDGDKRLVAYVLADPIENLARKLRTHLLPRFPDYMVPSGFVRLDKFPLSANGKLDRRALPKPDHDAIARDTYEAPRCAVERILESIWSELLNVERVGRNDSFFALGGHSLLALRLRNRIGAFGVDVTMSTIFESDSLAALAEVIGPHFEGEPLSVSAIMQIPRDSLLPLSFGQEQLWFLAKFHDDDGEYNISEAFRFRGSLCVESLRRALDTIWSRHEVLRSVFKVDFGQPEIRLLDENIGMPLDIRDLRDEPDAEVALVRIATADAHKTFDLECGPLIHARLFRLKDDEYVFLLVQHHIVTDDRSISILTRELNELYPAFLTGRPNPLSPLKIQYRDYAAWQRQWLSVDRIRTQSAYWRQALTDAPELLDLPTDRPRPRQRSNTGRYLPIFIDAELTKSLNNLSMQHSSTLFMTLLAAWGAVLSRLSGQDDLIIGTPCSTRNREQFEDLLGFFVNTLALRFRISGTQTVADLLTHVRQTVIAAQDHQDIPFEHVVEIVKPIRRLAHLPICQVAFAWDNDEHTELKLPELKTIPEILNRQLTKFDLELELRETGGRIVGALAYSTVLFEESTIRRHIGYLQAMLRAMVADPDQLVSRIDLLASDERTLLIKTWNSTEKSAIMDACFHHLFEQQVARSPQAVALVCEEKTVTYDEMNRRANALAHQLIELGVLPDELIGICMKRSPELIIGQLAIMKAGGAYVPLDPAYPRSRNSQILNDAALRIMIADEVGVRSLGGDALCGLVVLNPYQTHHESHTNPEVSDLTPRNLAYVIHTSGSTGRPKGVMIEHLAVVNLALSETEMFNVRAESKVLFFYSISFDLSVGELAIALASGASLYIAPDAVRYDPRKLWSYVAHHGITHVHMMPTFLHFNELPPGINPETIFIVGGEAVNSNLVSYLRARVNLFIGYGPTETTVYTTVWNSNVEDACEFVCSGRPFANEQVYILDPYQKPVPLGVVGEIYIGGVGVARGYLNRPELTQERFIVDTFSEHPIGKLYKSGDLGRYLENGNLVIVGRTDHQIKIRGFRIETGEIEACLISHYAVREAHVAACDHRGSKRLVAYVVGDEIDQLALTLRMHVASLLPDYMIPCAFVRLDEFPLMPNGKLNQAALPAPEAGAFAQHCYEAPNNGTELTIARIWSELLGVERVGRNDSFFDLGGHSLIAIKMVDSLQHAGLTSHVQDLFESPILYEFALTLRREPTISIPATKIASDTTALTPDMFPLIDLTQMEIDSIVGQVTGGVTNIQDIYALSPLQNGMLFHHLLLTKGDPYLLRSGKVYRNSAALNGYLEAVQRVIDRHDILRTAFVWTGMSAPAQVVWRRATLSVTELKFRPENGPIRDQLTNLYDPLQYRMDLTQAPLLRYVTTDNDDGTWTLLRVMHHMITDHISIDTMDDEIRLYLSGKENELLDPMPYRNLIFQTRRSEADAGHVAFFTQMLADIDEPTLPFELTANHHDGSQLHSSHRILPLILSRQLREHAKLFEVSVAALCHLAFARVIAQSSGQDQVVFGTVLVGRMRSNVGGYNGMGLFINTLPLRFDVDERPTHICVREMHSQLGSMLKHEYASLALAQRCSNVPSSMPLFSAVFNYRYIAPSKYCESDDDEIESFETEELSSYGLNMNVEEYGTTLGLTSIVSQPIDAGRICAYMQQALQCLADALKLTSSKPMRMLEILPEEELRTLLETWNSTAKDFPDKLCIHQLFERQVEATPHSIAVVYENQSITYAELNAHVNCLAHRLIKLGVRPDEPVVICVRRSTAMIVGLLAILKAGGAYVPLDPAHPSARLTHILNDVGPNIVLADEVGHAVLGESNLASLTELDPNLSVNESTCNPRVPGLTSRHLAYVMYTSGSTGTPKGVMVEHRGLVNLALSHIDTFNVDETSRILQFATMSADTSAGDIAMALISGATLHVASDAARQDPRNLWDYVAEHGVTHVSLVPALFRDSEFLPDIRTKPTVLMVGEPLSPQLACRLNDRVKLYNVYGPTETTVSASAWFYGGECTDNIVPIGRPLSNVRFYILNKHGQLVPTGVAGELYIGGSGVARGYINQPNLTAERFVKDPFADNIDARLYKTGDVARYLPDGRVVLLGRKDQQLKIRGFRIETGEIEACLTTHSAVCGAVVTVVHFGSEPQLVAYVVADAAADTAEVLRSYMTTRLPNYMIPVAFVRLDEFPLTPTGKIDLKALPLPDENARARHVYEAPRGPVEAAVASVWRDLFGIEQIGRNDSFLALGGDSLMAVRMMSRLAHVAVDLPLSIVFETSSMAELASVITARSNTGISALPSISRIPRDTELPLSFAQQRLWVTTQLDDVGHAYNIPLVLHIRGLLNMESLRRALDTIYARHDALRSIFKCIDEEPCVGVLDPSLGMPLTEHDLRNEPDAHAIAERIVLEETHGIFDLETGPLVRARLIWLQDQEHFFVLSQHHIVSDGWSMNIMIRELNTLYAAFEAGEPAPLPPMRIQYGDYASWQRQWLSADRLQGQADYWLATLANAPVLLDLPTDRPRPNHRSYAGHSLPVVLDSQLTTSLRTMSKQQGTTLFMTILAAWAAVLSRISGQNDLVIATPTANRIRPELEDLIGFFVNILALRIDLSNISTTAELLAYVRQTVVAAQDNQNLPFEHVMEIVRPQRSRKHTALFQVIFAWQNAEKTTVSLPGLDISECEPDIDTVKFDLELYLSETDDQINGQVCFATELFDSRTVMRQVEYLRATLQGMVDNLQRPVHTFDILTSSERRRLLETWNATETRFRNDVCAQQLIEQQVIKTPHSPALISENIVLTFAEMNARANGLACRLIELGVVPDQLVVICVARSPAMVIAVLAVLKAGGTYVPLDPTYSSQRLEYIFNDAACSIVLADEAGVTALGPDNLSKFNVIDPNAFEDGLEENPRVAELTSRHLAYVIYTSGSTGMPKGVMIEHRGLVNLALSQSELFGMTASSRMLQFASFGFDSCTAEIMDALSCGAALYIPPDSVRRDPHSLFTYMADHAITHAFLTPSFLQHAGDLPVTNTSLTLVVAGEAPSIVLLQKLAKQAKIFNAYGPTECTIGATTWMYTEDYADEAIPIGRPINNTRLYILDAYGQPVPIGTVGELYIGGVGVARGYLNRPDLTAGRFVPDNFGHSSDNRLYRTGDLARYLPDGNVIFLGRNDDQVNIRGFRIEPREIEVCMMMHAGVRQAFVVKQNIKQAEHLIAYVLAEPGEKLIDALRLHLNTQLPVYMVPAAIVRLDSIPLTPNGKLDYRALPIPNEDAFACREYEAPAGNVESVLAYTWSDLLGVQQISRRDNFFALGGHSLLAIRLKHLASERGVFCTLNDIFQYPVLADLAEQITRDSISQSRTTAKAVPVRSDGTEPPIFFLPTGTGDFSYAFGLSRHIQSNCPTFVLPWPSIHEPHPSTMQELASNMATLLKSVQTTGPYRICGYSFGGILAYAIAEHLSAAHESVTFLGLIDVPAPHSSQSEDENLKELLFYTLVDRFGGHRWKDIVSLSDKFDDLCSAEFIKAAREVGLYPASTCLDSELLRMKQALYYAQLASNYRPEKLPLPVCQFYAEESDEMDSDFPAQISPAEDPSKGWSRVVPRDNLRLIAVPGTHDSIISDPDNRIVVGQAINKALHDC